MNDIECLWIEEDPEILNPVTLYVNKKTVFIKTDKKPRWSAQFFGVVVELKKIQEANHF